MAEEAVKEKPVTDEIATIEKDIDIFAGWIKRLENPDPVLRTEAAGKGLKLYDEVDRDAHAGSVLQQRILAVVGKEWEVIPARSVRKLGRPSSTPQEKVIADFVSEVLENCNFDQARQELLRGILYGYYATEVMWQVLGGDVRVRKLIGKHPRRFIFTPERQLRLLTRQNMIEGEMVPDRKFIVFTYGDSDNPYGRGLGQKLWWPVWFKKNGVKFWLVFLEKFGMPTVKGKYPPGTLPEQQKALMDAIEAIQSDTGVKIPDSMDIEFLEASRAGTVTHEQLCDYMDRQISKAVLGQTLTTEIKGEGSYAASQTHNDVRQEIIEADADLLDSVFNEALIRWIVDYNFPGVTVYPKIKTYAGAKPDLKAQSEIDKTLVVDIGLPVGRAYFYETYGIPEPVEGEEMVSVPPKMPNSPYPGGRFAEKTPSGDATAIVVDRTAQRAMKTTDAVYMTPLKRLVNEAMSLDDLRNRVLDLWGEMPPDELGVIMAQGMMLAEMAGRFEVQRETEKKSPEFAEDVTPKLSAVFKLPFEEQETFFRNKLNIPTRKWTDLWKDQHAKGFMVAGAYKAELLADLRDAVDRAIAEGTALEDFRKDFDEIVARHGWSYEGTRNWRSELIYSTNIRTAYAAGRWEQLQDPDVKEFYGYLVYRHGDSRMPRPQHLAWDGLTLPADDPWWKTHYPPNGWGCKCRVFAATKEDHASAAKGGLGDAPRSSIDPKTGEPVGIDKGWGYNVGMASMDRTHSILEDVVAKLPQDIAEKLRAEIRSYSGS